MNRASERGLAFIGAFSLLLLALAQVPGMAPPGSAQEQGRLLITEVFYDTPGTDGDEEWVEIANVGDGPLALGNFKLGDEEQAGGQEGMARFPTGATLEANEVAVIAQSAAGFRVLFGANPDFELRNSDDAVPDMQPYANWATGEIALNNDGDEVVLLDDHDAIVDVVGYGQSIVFMSPAVPDVSRGYSIARVPAYCDTDGARDWQAQGAPSPGAIPLQGECSTPPPGQESGEPMAIGAIQGDGDSSPLLNETVHFEGVVTGMQEDQNARGAIFYTLFVQDIPGSEDADPDTSDAIAVFQGPRRPPYVPGDVVKVRGQVTEFYGLTEIDDSGLQIELLSTGQPLPAAIDLIPSNAGDPSYFESLEAMRVSMPAAVVVGPTFSGCGFAVAAGTRPRRFLRRELTDEISEIMPVLHNSDVSCGDFPQVMVGDVIRGLEGPLTYHFDQFKIVQQSTDDLAVSSAAVSAPPPPPEAGENQASIGSFNLHDYFDVVNQSGSPDEPVPSKEEVQVKQIKLARTISESLGCPTLLAVQEVESEALLRALAERLQAACGFTYSAVHRESSDARGIDLGLLADSRRIQVVSATSEQRCTPVSTDVPKTGTSCPTAQYPLFSRPPLQVDLLLDNMPYTVVVVHLKSKREGEQETEARRLAQAAAVAKLAQVRLDSNPEAHLVVLGDFNDYELSRTIDVLTSDNVGLINTATEIPLEQRYTYNFGGVLQMLDTIIVSPAVLTQVMSVNVVHVNADFPAGWAADVNTVFRSSDHDVPYVVVRTGDVDPAVAPTTTSTAEVPGEGSVVAPTAIQPAPLTPSDSAAGSQSPWVFGAIGALVGILGGAVLRTWRRHSRD